MTFSRKTCHRQTFYGVKICEFLLKIRLLCNAQLLNSPSEDALNCRIEKSRTVPRISGNEEILSAVPSPLVYIVIDTVRARRQNALSARILSPPKIMQEGWGGGRSRWAAAAAAVLCQLASDSSVLKSSCDFGVMRPWLRRPTAGVLSFRFNTGVFRRI